MEQKDVLGKAGKGQHESRVRANDGAGRLTAGKNRDGRVAEQQSLEQMLRGSLYILGNPNVPWEGQSFLLASQCRSACNTNIKPSKNMSLERLNRWCLGVLK